MSTTGQIRFNSSTRSGRQIHQSIAGHHGLSGEPLQRGPRTSLFYGERRTQQHSIRVGVPCDVVQEIVVHRGAHRQHETSLPTAHYVAARARAVHDADALDGNAPASQQITLRSDGGTHCLQRLAVQRIRIRLGVLHVFFFARVLIHHDRLPVDFEVAIAPAVELAEEISEDIPAIRPWSDQPEIAPPKFPTRTSHPS